VFVYNSNPVRRHGCRRTGRGLQREDLFTFARALYTDTAKYADILLPSTMQAEQYDIMVTWGHLYIMLNQPAIPAPGDASLTSISPQKLAEDDGIQRRVLGPDRRRVADTLIRLELAGTRGHHADVLKKKG